MNDLPDQHAHMMQSAKTSKVTLRTNGVIYGMELAYSFCVFNSLFWNLLGGSNGIQANIILLLLSTCTVRESDVWPTSIYNKCTDFNGQFLESTEHT